MSESKYTPGRFVWRELTTPDVAASRAFYSELLGWKITKASAVPGMDYWECAAGDRTVAGMFEMKMEGMPPFWGGYVSVPSVDSAVDAVKQGGGGVLHGPMDIPNVGRVATVRDPQGAVFNVFTDARGDTVRTGLPSLGEFCWEQLNTVDVAGAKAFYPAVTGWQVYPFGAMEVFGVSPDMQGGVASFMATPPGVPSHWLTYVLAGPLTDANARAKRLGAKVMMERIDVPTVGAFSVIQDPQGAIIALFEASMP